jgi:two-component system, LuxR family, response regulator FixJ
MDQATVFVVDDDEAVRDSLRWMIEASGNLRVEAYGSAEEFLSAYDPMRIACLVLDIRMPGMTGIELQKQLQARHSYLGIIFITAHGNVPTAVHAMRAGAIDFLTKPFNEKALLERITQCLDTARRERTRNAERSTLAARFALLTPREREIMRDVLAGKSSKTIADAHQISRKTVEAHRAKMMQKLRVKSVAELMHTVLPSDLH